MPLFGYKRPLQLIIGILLMIGALAAFENIKAWTPPTGAPATTNVPQPINVGPDAQQKDGILRILGDGGNALPGLYVPNDSIIAQSFGSGFSGRDPYVALEITGQSMLGSDAEVVGSNENLIYGNMDSSSLGNLLLLQNEGSTRFLVDRNGNATTTGKLTVGTDACIKDGLCLSNIDNLWARGAGENIYRLNGKVGIGTYSPQQTLHIVSTTSPGITIEAVGSVNLYEGPSVANEYENRDYMSGLTWNKYMSSTSYDCLLLQINDYSDHLWVTDFDFSQIPDSATVNGIVVSFNRFANFDMMFDNIVRLIDESGSVAGDNKASTTSDWPRPEENGKFTTYGGVSDTWGIAGLTGAKVKDPDFGIAVSARNSFPGMNYAYINDVVITVYYTNNSGIPWTAGVDPNSGNYTIARSRTIADNPQFSILTNGNIGIGSPPFGGAKLNVNGNLGVSGGIASDDLSLTGVLDVAGRFTLDEVGRFVLTGQGRAQARMFSRPGVATDGIDCPGNLCDVFDLSYNADLDLEGTGGTWTKDDPAQSAWITGYKVSTTTTSGVNDWYSIYHWTAGAASPVLLSRLKGSNWEERYSYNIYGPLLDYHNIYNDNQASRLRFYKQRGSGIELQNGDQLGVIDFYGVNSGGAASWGNIIASRLVRTSSRYEAALDFYATGMNGGAMYQAMTIAPNRPLPPTPLPVVGINNIDPGSVVPGALAPSIALDIGLHNAGGLPYGSLNVNGLIAQHVYVPVLNQWPDFYIDRHDTAMSRLIFNHNGTDYAINVALASSREKKTEIEPIKMDTSKIYELEPVNFYYKPDKNNPVIDRRIPKNFGLIAEDVEKYFPELVIYDNAPEQKGITGLRYDMLSVLILNEMKKLKAEADQSQAEITELKQANEELKDLVEGLIKANNLKQ